MVQVHVHVSGWGFNSLQRQIHFEQEETEGTEKETKGSARLRGKLNTENGKAISGFKDFEMFVTNHVLFSVSSC